MTHGILDMIDKRKSVYETDQKRSPRWRKLKSLTEKMIKEKKSEFIEGLKQKAIDARKSAHFFKAVSMFKDQEKPPTWSVSHLFPSTTDGEVSEKVAEFFNEISLEFNPISDYEFGQVDEWVLEHYQVAEMLKNAKKPKSKVRGDIYPELVSKNSDILALPLTNI